MPATTKVGRSPKRIQDQQDFAGPPTSGFQVFAAGVFSTRPITANDLPDASSVAKGALAAADKLKLDGTPCLIVHADGTTTAETTIDAAVVAAVSGDSIIIAPGSYNVSMNLAKDGVRLHLQRGSTVTWDAAGIGFLFDDAAGARSYSVTGYGVFIRKCSNVPLASVGDDTGGGGSVGVLRAIQPSSVVNFQCDTVPLIFSQTSGQADFVWLNGIYVDGGASVTLDINSLTVDRTSDAIYGYVNGVWWGNGNVNGRIGRVYIPSFDTGVLVTAAFQIVSQASPAGECRISSEDIDCDFPVANNSPSTAVGFWLTAKTIGGIGVSAGGKTYITAQKLLGGWSHQSGEFYLDTMKASGQYTDHVGLKPIIEVLGGTAWVDVQAFRPTGNNVAELIKVDGASALLHFRGSDMTGATTAANTNNADAVLVTAGTANLYSGNIVSDAAKKDLHRTGGALNVSVNVTYSPSKTSGIITKLTSTDFLLEGTANLFFTDARVRLNRLDQMTAPTAAVSFNAQQITNLADPSQATDATNKQYVDAQVAGARDVKDSVRVASTANVTIASPGSSIDGVTLSNGNRVLLKDQSTGSQNGIYVFNGAASSMTRAADADTSAEVTGGMFVWVNEGTVNADTGWLLITNDPITLGSTSLSFTQIATINSYTAVGPLAKSGTQFTTSMSTGKLIGRGTAGTGVMQEITLGTNLSLSGTTLNATGGTIWPFTGHTTDDSQIELLGEGGQRLPLVSNSSAYWFELRVALYDNDNTSCDVWILNRVVMVDGSGNITSTGDAGISQLIGGAFAIGLVGFDGIALDLVDGGGGQLKLIATGLVDRDVSWRVVSTTTEMLGE